MRERVRVRESERVGESERERERNVNQQMIINGFSVTCTFINMTKSTTIVHTDALVDKAPMFLILPIDSIQRRCWLIQAPL